MIVAPSLVKRCKNHFHNLLCGASLILGNNGFIWISPIVVDDHQQEQKRFQVPSTPGASSVETHTHVCIFSLKATLHYIVLHLFSRS